jgi:rod shape-determining protein MreD
MARPVRTWPAFAALIAALALEILPLADALQMLRPPFLALALIYWIMMWPQRIGLGTAFLFGIALDVLHGQLLGQNAIALTMVGFLTLNFHLQIRIFPLWQLTVTVLALLGVDALIRLLIDGFTGNPPAGIGPWVRALIGTLIWPVLMAILDRIRMTAETRPSDFN